MSFFNRLFTNGKSKVPCPRCIGKGEVDWGDIKRLNRDLKWRPGKCAYCDGIGKVDYDMEFKVPVDETYLSIDIPIEERQKVINNEVEARKRAETYDMQMDEFIEQIRYLYFTGKLEVDKITEFYMLPKVKFIMEEGEYLNEKAELVDYINRVIENKKQS